MATAVAAGRHNVPVTSLRRARASLIAALLVPGLLLAGCGGEDTKEKASTKPTADLPSGNVKVPEGVTLTKAGTELAFGEPAVVAYHPNAQRSSVLSLTVNSVQTGRITDLAGFELGSTKTSTPYYVRVTVQNVGTGDLSRIAIPIYAVDAKNQLVRPASFSTSFPRCPSTALPEGFGPGKTYQTCLVYLVEPPGTLVEMSYRPLQAFEPITWQGTITPAPAKKATKRPGKKGTKKAQP
jgi:hypothetical protein